MSELERFGRLVVEDEEARRRFEAITAASSDEMLAELVSLAREFKLSLTEDELERLAVRIATARLQGSAQAAQPEPETATGKGGDALLDVGAAIGAWFRKQFAKK